MNLLKKRNSSTTLRKNRIFNSSFYDFGFYLAGFIDSNGFFDINLFTLVLHEKDATLAYWIKSQLKFGKVFKLKKNIIYKLKNINGLIKVLYLIDNKIRNFSILKQIESNLLPYLNDQIFLKINLNKDNNFNNYWLTGFIDANGLFINNKYFILELHNHNINILEYIKEYLGGKISNKDNNILLIYSTRKIIKYLDKYQLLSYKLIEYNKWKKAYEEEIKKI